MSDVEISKDIENATFVVSATFAARPEQVWDLWADPRQLERWWGPEPYPATVVEHELRPGGRVAYYMTGPEGDQHDGYWEVVATDPPHRLVFEDGFAEEAGLPDDALPIARTEVIIEALEGAGSRMTIVTFYDSASELEQVLAMGMEQGIRTAVEQIDALLPRA